MLYKRRDSRYWWIKLKSQNRVYQQSTGTTNRRRAKQLEGELRDQLWRNKHLSKGKTFGDAAIRWIDDHQHKKSLEADLLILEWFRPHLEHTLLIEITRDRVEELRKLKKGKPGTINRHMALLRSILRAARDDWEWVEKIPKVPMYPITKGEPRFLTLDQFLSLVKELPSHLAGPAWFSVSTGLRASPIMSLRWNWIYRDGVRIPPQYMKNAKFFTIPPSSLAWMILAEQWGKHPEFVFTYRGKPITGQFTTRAWRKACKRSGVKANFHAMRHTWASWHVQNGTPLNVVQELGGWSSYEMTQVYAHLAPATLQEWADNA